jgi:uncharacterized protein YecE (DUF72 family)
MSQRIKPGDLVSTPRGTGRFCKLLPDGRIAVEFTHTVWFRPDEVRIVRGFGKDADKPREGDSKPVSVPMCLRKLRL